MKVHLNTLFVTTDACWLSKDGETVKISLHHETLLRLPLHNLAGIVMLGWEIGISPQLMYECTQRNISMSFCNPYGKFLASVQGPMSGNVLLRRAQYKLADNAEAYILIAREMIAAKIANARTLLLRAARTYQLPESVTQSIQALASACRLARQCTDPASLRGIEGNAAEQYFSALSLCQTTVDPKLIFTGRSKRPPLDMFNALLSFLYTMLAHDTRSALESVGLDSAVGFLHRDRPGRPSLALDLMEEFRAPLADRLALSIFNRKQLTSKDFTQELTGAFILTDEARKRVLTAWQERKNETIIHPVLQEKTTLGLLIYIQAQLLARHLRGDHPSYIPFIWK